VRYQVLDGLIYVYKNKVTGKQYVGQTTQSFSVRHGQHLRANNNNYFENALQKHTEDFEYHIVEEGVPTYDMLNELECHWIAKLNSFYPNGYNMTLGGKNREYTEQTRKKMSINHADFTGGNHPQAKTVYQISLQTGEITAEYKAIIEAKKATGILHISSVCRGKRKQAGGYFWSYTSEYDKEFVRSISTGAKYGTDNPASRQVLQIDKDTNEIIAEFDTIREAGKALGLISTNNISTCCRGRLKTAYGFKWKYKEEEIKWQLM